MIGIEYRFFWACIGQALNTIVPQMRYGKSKWPFDDLLDVYLSERKMTQWNLGHKA